MSHGIRSSLRKAFVGISLIGGVGGSIAIYNSVDSLSEVKEVGAVRFGRAVVTVAQIVVDYKTSFRNVYYPSKEYDEAMSSCHQRSAERLLDLARRNGGVFIKTGQHLAALEYLIPPEYTQTLSVLHSNAPENPFSDVERVFLKEFNKPISEMFSEFDEKPIGSASLAQVHAAKLKETGQKVAVKVQHRRVYKNSRTDMNTMEFLVNVAGWLIPEFKLQWLVDEIKRNLPLELDFEHEAHNADRIRNILKHLKFLKIPTIYYEYTSRRVLTMEFCEGEHINNLKYLDANGIDRHDVGRKMGRIISEMIFNHGYLHSDPHPGNVLVRKNERGNAEIVLLDHGLYLKINDDFRSKYTDLWLALLHANQQEIRNAADAMGVGEFFGLFACIVARRSWKSVTQGISRTKMNSNEKDELKTYAASLIPQISEVLHRVPREMLLILKTNDLLRAIEAKLETSHREDAMIEMSKCVLTSRHELTLKKETAVVPRLRISLNFYWSYAKVLAYEYYLKLKYSWPLRWFSLA